MGIGLSGNKLGTSADFLDSYGYRLGAGKEYIRLPRFPVGGGSSVFPTAGNVGYYSANDPSNLGFSSGVLINSLLDQSSAGNDLAQIDPLANPSYLENSLKPWLSRLVFGGGGAFPYTLPITFTGGGGDSLGGMAAQAGDFTYMFKVAFNALSSTGYILSHTTGSSAVVLLSDNYIYLRDTTGANDIGLTGHTVELGEHVYVITRESDSLKYYVNSCLKDTIDVTGRAFELDTFGRSTDSLAGLVANWGVWNRALNQEEINTFSYLRSAETNNILRSIDGAALTPACSI